MTINNKNSCSENLASVLGKSTQWRLKMKASYPADSRNGKASDMLERLASEMALTDEEWALLEPHYSWASETWTKAVSAATRQVGFSRYPRTPSAFVCVLLDALNQQVVAA